MPASFPVDTREFRNSLRLFVHETGRDAGEIMRVQARLAVKEAIKLTPPFGKSPVRESFGKQRRAGVEAVTGDFNAVYKPLAELEMLSAPTNAMLAASLKKLARAGKTAEIAQILSDLGFQNPVVAAKALAEHLSGQRNRRGRIGRRPVRQFVVSNPSVNKLRRKLLSRIGRAKAGWPHAQAGVKVPAWISRHQSESTWSDKSRDPKKPSIIFGNDVGYIQGVGGELRIMKRVFRMRARNMERALERMAKRNAAKANA